jgi:hypothetical protein
VRVTWVAQCRPPGSSDPNNRAGDAQAILMRRRGNAFSFDIAANRVNAEPWTGTVSGTVARSGVTLNVRAGGTIDGENCDSGPLTLTLERSPKR